MSTSHEISIHKASPVAGTQAPSVTISITKEWPESNYKLPFDELHHHFSSEAQLLFTALSHSLPGGTLDQLFCLMCKHKASLFRVPYTEPKKKSTVEKFKTPDKITKELLVTTLKELFEQHCSRHLDSNETYNHDHISANENAQLVLIECGMLDPKKCMYEVDRTINDITI